MATFPSISPVYGMRKRSKPKVRVISLGDGYEFRSLYGLPHSQDPKIYDLTFNVSETESDVIEAFLRSIVADQASFYFTPPAESLSKTGTYSISSDTVTISITNHGVAIGDKVNVTISSTTVNDLVVVSSADQNTFTVTTSSFSGSGSVSISMSGTGKYVCDSWTKTIPYNERAIINCSFREVFEP